VSAREVHKPTQNYLDAHSCTILRMVYHIRRPLRSSSSMVIVRPIACYHNHSRATHEPAAALARPTGIGCGRGGAMRRIRSAMAAGLALSLGAHHEAMHWQRFGENAWGGHEARVGCRRLMAVAFGMFLAGSGVWRWVNGGTQRLRLHGCAGCTG